MREPAEGWGLVLGVHANGVVLAVLLPVYAGRARNCVFTAPCPSCRSASDMFRAVHGEAAYTSDSIACLTRLCNIAIQQGRLADAEQWIRVSVTMIERVWGATYDHPDIVRVFLCLGDLHRVQKRYEDCERVSAAAVAMCRRLWPHSDHVELQLVGRNLHIARLQLSVDDQGAGDIVVAIALRWLKPYAFHAAAVNVLRDIATAHAEAYHFDAASTIMTKLVYELRMGLVDDQDPVPHLAGARRTCPCLWWSLHLPGVAPRRAASCSGVLSCQSLRSPPWSNPRSRPSFAHPCFRLLCVCVFKQTTRSA